MAAVPRGLSLAREKGWLLVWDDQDHLHLWNRTGKLQGQARPGRGLVAACMADDGSAVVAVGRGGEIWWLAPDLAVRWQQVLKGPATAAALDPFGQYLAVADNRGHLRVLDRYGRRIHETQTPRPLHHLAFVPAAPFLIGGADYGLVVCFDLKGHWAWQDGLVAHIGSLSVSGDGEQVVLACFSEGLRNYSVTRKQAGSLAPSTSLRLAALTFDGKRALVADLGNRLLLLDGEGKVLAEHRTESPAVALGLAPLGDWAAVVLAVGAVVWLDPCV